MGFNSAFKGLKLLKTPGNGRLNNLNDPVLNVLRYDIGDRFHSKDTWVKKYHGRRNDFGAFFSFQTYEFRKIVGINMIFVLLYNFLFSEHSCSDSRLSSSRYFQKRL